MPAHRDAISVRTTRLNNLIVDKGNLAAVAGTSKASGRRITNASVGGTWVVSPFVTEALTRESLLDVLCLLYNECDKDGLKKRDRNISDFVNKYRAILEETRQLRVNIDDFNVKTMIGKGYFGDVHLVIERQTKDVYAMKKIKKLSVNSSQIKEERDIMSRRSSDWITKLQYAFQDNDHLYLIMEFLPGGDLLSLMSRHGPFEEDVARFYLAEMTLALHSLHMMGYVHRDIKPENILIDRFGHIKLADFGNAAALNRDGHVSSLSPVGTPDYIAPELLQTISINKLTKSVHDVSCDFWSMGIIGYEMICEVTPFHEENVHETYTKILSHCENSVLTEIVNFPSDFKVSANFKNLIESLVTAPTKRLSYEKILKHPYFNTLQWDTLRSQVPPIIPSVNAEDDTSNYDDNSRSKATLTVSKKSLTTNMKSNDFSGKDLPFLGYSFIYMEKPKTLDEGAYDDARILKLNTKLKDLQSQLKERIQEINKLRQDLLRAEQMAKQTNTQSMILQDAKEEIKKMKEIIKEKTVELANCKTQIKTLQNSVKVEQDMWQKKESTITDLLRMNRQKYEEANIFSEQRYEKLIAKKKIEIENMMQKLEAREIELGAKNEECVHLQEKLVNYKEMLRKIKDQSHLEKTDFESNKLQLADTYEQKLMDLRTKLRLEKDSKTRLTMELRDVRTELDDSKLSSKSSEAAKNATAKSNDEILKRLNQEILTNNQLRTINDDLENQLTLSQHTTQDLQKEVNRLQRELQVTEYKNLAQSSLSIQSSPYNTAPGSLTELHAIEEQLRADLDSAKKNEQIQKDRADDLQSVVIRLEQMMERFNAQTTSSVENNPTANTTSNDSEETLENKYDKLQDRLGFVREQLAVERKNVRTTSVELWKVEKQLQEATNEHKITKRRLELTEDRIKKVQAEKEEMGLKLKANEYDIGQRDQRIQELKDEIMHIKRDLQRENKKWEQSERDRMKSKSMNIDNLSTIQKLERSLAEVNEKLIQSQQKCDSIYFENKKLVQELSEEQEKSSNVADTASACQMNYQQLKENYKGLKYACTITDNQLTEVEAMFESEQKRNQENQMKIDKLYSSIREKEDAIVELKKQLFDKDSQKVVLEGRISTLEKNLKENISHKEELQKKCIEQYQQLIENTNQLYQSQERVEVVSQELKTCQTLNDNLESELNLLKEENTRILSELFGKNADLQTLQELFKKEIISVGELNNEIQDIQNVLSEKEYYFVEREIKYKATLAQHKKLIDYLQLKVEDLSQKKKKTFSDIFFGSGNNSSKKENISPNAVESSILYRTLREELRREKQRCASLEEQAKKNNSTKIYDGKKQNESAIEPKETSPSKYESSRNYNINNTRNNTNTTKLIPCSEKNHRFEMKLQECSDGTNTCIRCLNQIFSGPYWKCRECKSSVHSKCRNIMMSNEGSNKEDEKSDNLEVISSAVDDIHSEYSYEGKLDGYNEKNLTDCNTYDEQIIFRTDMIDVKYGELKINCAYEIELEKILLLGCNSGLYAFHIDESRLVQIIGINSVNCIAVSIQLAKAILVGSSGETLYQCDFRQLISRCQSSISFNTPLEACVLDLPFASSNSNEKWQIVKISNETENAIDSVAIAATSSSVVILKYDVSSQKFRPVRALDTATYVIAVLFTRHTAIVSSDKFYEIDMNTYSAEEFIDPSDQSLSHTSACTPIVAVRVTSQEYVLCFLECGVFVDEYGCRSRPYDLTWKCTATHFIYREPFLYIAHFQSVEIIRLHRSFSREIKLNLRKDADADTEVENLAPNFKTVNLDLYMPTLIAESGNNNIYVLATDKISNSPQIHYIDVFDLFKHKFNESIETLSSIETQITIESTGHDV